ncbi:DUF106 domain-containing protein [Archaeoglobus sp.]
MKLLKNVVMFVGIAFMIGIFFPTFRVELAQAVDPVLHPLLGLGKIHVVIFVLATFTAFYSTLIQKFTIDRKFMIEAQKKISEFQKKYLKAVKENNQFLLKQLEKEKDEINRIQAELMSMNFRTMFYTVVVTVPIWVWLWYVIYDISHIGLTNVGRYPHVVSHFMVNVPFAGTIHVSKVLIFPWWLFWYILCSITLGQVFRRILLE